MDSAGGLPPLLPLGQGRGWVGECESWQHLAVRVSTELGAGHRGEPQPQRCHIGGGGGGQLGPEAKRLSHGQEAVERGPARGTAWRGWR